MALTQVSTHFSCKKFFASLLPYNPQILLSAKLRYPATSFKLGDIPQPIRLPMKKAGALPHPLFKQT